MEMARNAAKVFMALVECFMCILPWFLLWLLGPQGVSFMQTFKRSGLSFVQEKLDVGRSGDQTGSAAKEVLQRSDRLCGMSGMSHALCREEASAVGTV